MGFTYFDIIKPAMLPEEIVSDDGNWKECIHRQNHHTDHLSKDGPHKKMKIHQPLVPNTQNGKYLVTVILSLGLIPIAYLKDK